MKEFKEKIPKRFKVGGQDIEVCQVEYCESDSLGDCFVAQGLINIAKYASRGVEQSEASKFNSFWHELTHSILVTMGEYELNKNETFVCSFSGFLTEAIRSLEYEEEST